MPNATLICELVALCWTFFRLKPMHSDPFLDAKHNTNLRSGGLSGSPWPSLAPPGSSWPSLVSFSLSLALCGSFWLLCLFLVRSGVKRAHHRSGPKIGLREWLQNLCICERTFGDTWASKWPRTDLAPKLGSETGFCDAVCGHFVFLAARPCQIACTRAPLSRPMPAMLCTVCALCVRCVCAAGVAIELPCSPVRAARARPMSVRRSSPRSSLESTFLLRQSRPAAVCGGWRVEM